MDVAAYIKELLYQDHFIYVPGLGTFLTRKTAGIYNQEQQRFYPPKNSIDFVAEEKKDETLENYISRQKNISIQAAQYFINKFVDQLKNDSVTKNIPVNEVLFPAEKEPGSENQQEYAFFNQENFGLLPIKVAEIKEIPDLSEKEAVTKQDYVENFYHEFSNNIPEEKQQSKFKKSTGFWTAIFLLLAVCILGCYTLYLYYPDIYNSFFSTKQDTTTVIQQPAVDTVTHVPVTAKQTVSDTDLTKKVEDIPVPKKVVPASKPTVKDREVVEAWDPDVVEKSPYEIIGATFKTLKGAKTFLSQLKAKGMQHAKILKTSGKLKLITFGSFKNKETAQAALDKLRARDPHSDAHIQHYIIK